MTLRLSNCTSLRHRARRSKESRSMTYEPEPLTAWSHLHAQSNRWRSKVKLLLRNLKTEARRKPPHFLPLRFQRPTKIKPESCFLASGGPTRQTFGFRATSKAEERGDHEGTKFKLMMGKRGRWHRHAQLTRGPDAKDNLDMFLKSRERV